jgi:hypothetical protein
MAWWHRLFSPKAGAPSENSEYKVAFCLYSVDGKRGVEVRSRSDGRACFVEREWVEGTTFEDRGTRRGNKPLRNP